MPIHQEALWGEFWCIVSANWDWKLRHLTIALSKASAKMAYYFAICICSLVEKKGSKKWETWRTISVPEEYRLPKLREGNLLQRHKSLLIFDVHLVIVSRENAPLIKIFSNLNYITLYIVYIFYTRHAFSRQNQLRTHWLWIILDFFGTSAPWWCDTYCESDGDEKKNPSLKADIIVGCVHSALCEPAITADCTT